jgi:hypothetical protein
VSKRKTQAILTVVFAMPLCGQSSSTKAQTAKHTACQILSIQEVAKFTGLGALAIVPDESGPNGSADYCAWRVPGKADGVILTLENLDVPDLAEKVTGKQTSAERVKNHFRLLRTQAYGGYPPEAPVTGLGDEAFYRDFEHAKGGCLLIRRSSQSISFSGSASKDVYIGLAGLVLQRM